MEFISEFTKTMMKKIANILPTSMLTDPSIFDAPMSMAFDYVTGDSKTVENHLSTNTLENLLIGDDKSDVTFRFFSDGIPKAEIKAHRLPLAAKNSVFMAMMVNDTTEKENGIITIEDCDSRAFMIFLKYLYTSCISDGEISIDLLQISDKYLEYSLKDQCEKKLAQNITSDNVLEIFLAAIRYNCKRLTDSAILFIKQNMKKLMSNSEFFEELYSSKEAVKYLLTTNFFVTLDVKHFQPLDNFPKHFSSYVPSFSYSHSLKESFTTTTLQIPGSTRVSTGDLVWQVDFIVEESITRIKKVFLQINSKTSYFEGCTSDIIIILESNDTKKNLVKFEQNVQINKRTSPMIFVIRHDDFMNLAEVLGEESFESNDVYEMNVTINLSFYNIIRSPPDNEFINLK